MPQTTGGNWLPPECRDMPTDVCPECDQDPCECTWCMDCKTLNGCCCDEIYEAEKDRRMEQEENRKAEEEEYRERHEKQIC